MNEAENPLQAWIDWADRLDQLVIDAMVYGSNQIRLEWDNPESDRASGQAMQPERVYGEAMQSPVGRTMIDLRSMTLTPFQTKAKMACGEECVFVEPPEENADAPVWGWLSKLTWEVNWYDYQGRCGNDGAEIASISHPWKPKINDEVFAYGFVRKLIERNTIAGRELSMGESENAPGGKLTVQTNPDSLGFLDLTDNHNRFYRCHFRQLKFIRRPN